MVTVVKAELGVVSDWLLFEEDESGRYSRENVTVAPGQILVSGQVVGYNAAGTQVVAYDDVGPDGDVAAGILVFGVTTGVGETAQAAMVVRHARVAPSQLTFPNGLGAPAKANALADLAANGIVLVREA
jgi:hypothetical protein